MRLVIGVTEILPQWQILLSQIGVSFEEITDVRTLKIEHYSTIIVSSKSDQISKVKLLKYIKEGGALLCEAHIAEWLFKTNTYKNYVKFVEEDKNSRFPRIIPGFIQKSLILPIPATDLTSDLGRKLIQTVQIGKGYAVVLPGGLSSIVLSCQVTRRNFPSSGPLLPSERVSRQSKNTIRSIVQRALEYLHTKRNIPFVYLWPFPNGQETIFNFRIDTDFSTPDKLNTLYDLCCQHDIPATWFVETGSSESFIEQFSNMESQEIGLHGHQHRIWRQYQRNERDVKKGIDVLLKATISPKGYASPFGKWNISLSKAIEHHGFVYSSEFALDFDDLPFYPYLEDRFSSMLQIPVHPITTARLRNAHHSTKEMKQYYENFLQQCLRFQFPFFIYDHPTGVNLDVIKFIFNLVQEHNLQPTSLLNYAEWWKQKSTYKTEILYQDNSLIQKINNSDPTMRLCIRVDNNRWSLIPLKGKIDLDRVQWKTSETGFDYPVSMAELSRIHYKMIVNDFLQYYWSLNK